YRHRETTRVSKFQNRRNASIERRRRRRSPGRRRDALDLEGHGYFSNGTRISMLGAVESKADKTKLLELKHLLEKLSTMKFASLAALSLLAFAPKSGAGETLLNGNSFEEQALEAGLHEVRERRDVLIVYISSLLKAFVFAGVAKQQGKEAAVLALDSDAGDVVPPSLRGAANWFDTSLGDGEGESCIPRGGKCRQTFALSSQCCSGHFCALDRYGGPSASYCARCQTNIFCPGGRDDTS
ncbi:hypothetical protein THAOC_01798, partial [Thalassiosira oceanica]